MSKMSELDLCVIELRSAAQSLNTVADSLTSLFSGSQPRTSVQPESKPTSKPLTLEDVRAVLAEKSRNGHTAKIRELLEKHGAAKLSEIDPQKYAALLAEAEVLGNG
ncbi:MAG: DNA ligase [Clostridia bacterium]|nr:DNA ligase [Candidatus Saccharibacteria bacterium]NCC86161.1 DNA ligase [Clostridia bacterium]